ncbi:hypothetical protein K2X30_12105 [bacterium]|jgi:hypothetical protein|nr:hypothetical protein [bacterium]
MKTSTLLGLALLAGFQNTASAAPLHWLAVTNYKLDQVQIDPLQIEYQGVTEASLILDLASNVITLDMTPAFHCPDVPGLQCSPPRPIFVRLPLDPTLSQPQLDECKIAVFVAQVDARPADGSLRKITVRDNRGNICPTKQKLPDVHVYYETAYVERIPVLKSVTTRSSFSGSIQ